jgi:hypothetical protein
MLGFIHYRLIINLLQSNIRSIEALTFPKKLVFKVGKKRWQADKLFCNFGIAGLLVRIANVLGCVGWQSFQILFNRFETY